MKPVTTTQPAPPTTTASATETGTVHRLPLDSPHPAGAAANAALRAEAVTKDYGTGPTAVRALAGVDLAIEAGRFTAIMGPSGSGKSTLMHCLAGLDRPTAGRVFLGTTDVTALNDRHLTLLRRSRIGFVFQAFNLLPVLTAKQNITLPLDLAGAPVDPSWFAHLTDVLGLTDRLTHRPGELSGGQQQRVAIARALIGRPDVVFADEPTGALDSRTSAEIMAFMRRSVREFGQTIVMVTHDPGSAAYADQVIVLADGQIAHTVIDPTPERIVAAMSHEEA